MAKKLLVAVLVGLLAFPPTANAAIGSAEFDLEIKPEFSPKISILAYYIRADNEVVTASLDIDVANCFPNPV